MRMFFPQGTVPNKFYVHNDVFRYQDEVFGDSDSEPPEGIVPAGFPLSGLSGTSPGKSHKVLMELLGFEVLLYRIDLYIIFNNLNARSAFESKGRKDKNVSGLGSDSVRWS